MKLFDVMDTNRKTYDYLALHGIAGITKLTEGQDFPEVTSVEGDTAAWTQSHYGALVPVTKDMRKFDLHNQIKSVVRSISIDAFQKLEQSMADVFGHCQDTSYTDVYAQTVSALTPDAKELCDDAHDSPSGSTTFDNVITSDDGTTQNDVLSRAVIANMRSIGLTYKDPVGINRPIYYDTLIVPPALEDLARRIVETDRMPGSANNDINPVKGWIKNVYVWPQLQTLADSTDGSAFWFLADSSRIKDVLQLLFAERPSLDAPETVYKNKNWNYSIDYYYTIGRGYPAGFAGSLGDLSTP